MIYVITKVENERIAKFISVETMEEAMDELARVLPNFPDAFIHEAEDAHPMNLKVNLDNSVVVDPLPPHTRPKSGTELLLEELGFSPEDIAAAKERVKARRAQS
jgi:hypothetical protein